MATFGSLNLNPPVPLEQGVAMLDVLDTAIQDTISRGLFFQPKPTTRLYEGVLPQDLSRFDDNKLGDLLDEIARWCNWASFELTLARQARNQSEARLSVTRARLRLNVKHSEEKRVSNPDKDDMVECDQKYLEAKRLHIYYDAKFDFAKTVYDNGVMDWETVSRHITQRGQEIDRMVRGSNVANIPVASSAFRRP